MIIRDAEGCAPASYALWDSVWNVDQGVADWAVSAGDEPQNIGGLRAKSAISTAAILALFTDKRIDESHPLFFLADGDPRGWWGDGIDVRDDLFESPLGSHLWLLERAPMTIRGQSVAEWAKQFALEALAPLQAQGLVKRIVVETSANSSKGRLEIIVQLFARDGLAAFDRRFDVVWNQQVAG